MVKDWLLEKIRGHALHAGRKEVEKFVAGLAAMDDRDLGVIVARPLWWVGTTARRAPSRKPRKAVTWGQE